MATTNNTNNQILKKAGPKSVEELQRKGPPTREEIEAISEKYGMGVALTADENSRFLDYFQQRRNAWDIGTFLSVAYPNCEWSIQPQTRMDRMADDGSGQSANDLDLLVWDEDNPLPKPTKAEIDKMRPFVQYILDQQAYLTLRAKAYGCSSKSEPNTNEVPSAVADDNFATPALITSKKPAT